ncbi:MAG TPA: methyltransferase domain-containing protein, partial [Gammaproteobacteria bacterium]|nr:methyltransferase domain-containing protein [Gammaproteobacteria bacterium]
MAKRKKKPTLAEKADRHLMYQEAVQSTEFEIEFYEDRFRDLRGKRRKPKTIREDFCGTALFAAEWCKSNPKRRAIGVDLCAATLQWGMDNILNDASASVKKRITLLNEDVLTVTTEKVDIVCAMNFSYCIFKSRDLLRTYFKNVLRGLKNDGLFFLDLMGGT